MRRLLLITLILASAAACASSKSASPQPTKAMIDASTYDARLVVRDALKIPETDETAPEDEVFYGFEAIGPVARIGEEEISAAYFNYYLWRIHRNLSKDMAPKMQTWFKDQLLTILIDERLVMMKVKAAKIGVTKEELDAEVIRLNAFGEKVTIADAYSEEEKRIDTLKHLLAHKYFARHHGVAVSPEEVSDYYDSNPQKFTRSEQVRARHILIKIEPGDTDAQIEAKRLKANELAEAARTEGADFAALAREHSEGPSASKGGDLGLFTRERMVKPFSDAAFTLSPGEISDPVKTRFGWHVIQCVEHEPAHTEPLSEVREQIRARLLKTKLRSAYKRVVKEARENTEIIILEENIRSTQAPPRPPGQRIPRMPDSM